MDDAKQPEQLKAIVVLSGGLDSTTALYWAITKYDVVGAISFNYGQKHKIELEHAKEIVEYINREKKLDIKHKILDVPITADRSSLVNEDIEVPSGHYEAKNMKVTVVNNRNAIMFSLATAWAIDLKVDKVVVGIHAGDHAVYPDCRPAFINKFNKTMQVANEGFINKDFEVIAPFVYITKADIAELGILLDVPIGITYSDYEGGKVQKGRSGTSVERIEAISIAYNRINKLIKPFTESHKHDPTEYEEKEYALNLLIKKAKSDRLKEILVKIDSFFDIQKDYNNNRWYEEGYDDADKR